jgi:hypothetical protein
MFQKLRRHADEPPEEKFWRWVQENLPDRRELGIIAPSFAREARTEIARYCADLVVELSHGKDRLPEVVISAEGLREHFPKVIDLVKKAPQSDDFRAVAFRQPLPLPTNFAVAYQRGDELSLSDVWFALRRAEGELELDLYVHGINGPSADKIKSACFLMLDRLLGEYVVATRIGPIEWLSLPADPAGMKLRPLKELPQGVKELLPRFRDARPTGPAPN